MTTKALGRNKAIIERKAKMLGQTIGLWDSSMEKVSLKELTKVIDAMDFGGSTDVPVSIRRKKYVVEIANVDAELDFKLYSQEEFEETYGWDYYEDEE